MSREKSVVSIPAEDIGDIPEFIIGLPDDPHDAELAKSKFDNILRYIRKIEPEIEKASCKIKSSQRGKSRRYELHVSIVTPHKKYVYADSGWDLPKLFDEMSDSLKEKFAHKSARRKIESARKGSQKDEAD